MAELRAERSMAVPLAAFAAGAVVAVLVGVLGTAHDPTPDGTTTLWFASTTEMKIALSVVVGVLVVLQVIGALWLYGRLPMPTPSWLGTAHRASGTVALLLSTFVAYHCLWGLGLETGSYANGAAVQMRVVVHGLLGCAVFGAVVVKLVAVRSHRAPGWLLPVAGGLLFALLMTVVLTSAGWYLTELGWPSSDGY